MEEADQVEPSRVDSEPVATKLLAVIIPVYKNEESIPRLCAQLSEMQLPEHVECRVVFVVDGSPDRSAALLEECVTTWKVPATLVLLSRNFGSFSAIRAGLERATGDYFAVIAADLQEPPSLIPQFVERLVEGDVDLVLGQRKGRADPFVTRTTASVFWHVYRRFVQPTMPVGGVDVFACDTAVRDTILQLREANSSLIGQLLWIGFRRATIPYERLPRQEGKSGWTFSKKMRYLSDSIFSFTDLPIRFLLLVGSVGSALVAGAAIAVTVAWFAGVIDVPGYTPIMLAILLVGFVVILGLGIVGSYVWRTYENSKQRPLTIVQTVKEFPGTGCG